MPNLNKLASLPTPDVPTGEILVPATTHAASLGALAAAAMGWLPGVIAIIPAIYYLILIWESKTVQHWINNRRMVWRARKIARLRAKEKVITAKLEAMRVLKVARQDARALVEGAKVQAAKDVVHNESTIQSQLPKV